MTAPEHRPARDKSTLRDPEPADLWFGGRRVFQLLIDMAAGGVTSCGIRVLEHRREIRLGYPDGTQMSGADDWSAMEIFGAILWLRNETRPMEERSLKPGMGEMEFLIEPQTGLLPPEIPVLLCQFGILPIPGMYLRLRVMTEKESRAWTREMEEMQVPMRTIREDG